MTQDIQPDDIKIEPAMQAGSEHTYYNLVITKMLSPVLAEDLKNQIVQSIKIQIKISKRIEVLKQNLACCDPSGWSAEIIRSNIRVCESILNDSP